MNPGLCWGISSCVLEAGNGFNAKCLDCAGDSVFVAEYLNWDCFQYDHFLDNFQWFQEIKRSLPFRAELDGVSVDIIHVHHGYLEERNYNGVRYAIDGFPPIETLVDRDENGLLLWRNANCIERQIMKHTKVMHDNAAVDRIFDHFGYSRFKRASFVKNEDRVTKPLFQTSESSQKFKFK